MGISISCLACISTVTVPNRACICRLLTHPLEVLLHLLLLLPLPLLDQLDDAAPEVVEVEPLGPREGVHDRVLTLLHPLRQAGVVLPDGVGPKERQNV